MFNIKVIETKFYLRVLSKTIHKGQDEDDLRDGIKKFVGENPLSGDVITGTGGLRKIRYPIPGKGKSGGYRIIYYFYNENHPLNLLTIYPKSKTEDLSAQEKQIFSKFIKELKEIYTHE